MHDLNEPTIKLVKFDLSYRENGGLHALHTTPPNIFYAWYFLREGGFMRLLYAKSDCKFEKVKWGYLHRL